MKPRQRRLFGTSTVLAGIEREIDTIPAYVITSNYQVSDVITIYKETGINKSKIVGSGVVKEVTHLLVHEESFLPIAIGMQLFPDDNNCAEFAQSMGYQDGHHLHLALIQEVSKRAVQMKRPNAPWKVDMLKMDWATTSKIASKDPEECVKRFDVDIPLITSPETFEDACKKAFGTGSLKEIRRKNREKALYGGI